MSEDKLDPEVAKISEELGLVISRTGKYRLCLFYLDSFSRSKSNRGIISVFLSGKSSGVDIDMDQKCYECPNELCNGLLEPRHYHVVGKAFCPKCHRGFPRTELVGEMIYDATVDGWAKHISRYIRALNMDCDVLLHRLKSSQSIIEADAKARTDPRAGKLLNASREAEEVLFTMQRMIDETSGGRSLESAIKAFLLA